MAKKKYATEEERLAGRRAWREANRERRAKCDRAYREANREKLRTQKLAYLAANREKALARMKAYREANPEKIAARMKAYGAIHGERLRSRQRLLRAVDPEGARARARAALAARRTADPKKLRSQKRKYAGLPTPSRPEPEHCELCFRLPGKKPIQLDHCHTTGIFRGWLCHRCNLGLGGLGDNIEGLERALAYLKRAYAS